MHIPAAPSSARRQVVLSLPTRDFKLTTPTGMVLSRRGRMSGCYMHPGRNGPGRSRVAKSPRNLIRAGKAKKIASRVDHGDFRAREDGVGRVVGERLGG